MSKLFAPSISFKNLVQSAHLSFSAFSTGIALTDPNMKMLEKTVSIIANLAGSFFTLPKKLYYTYLKGSVVIGVFNQGYQYYYSSNGVSSKSYIEEKEYQLAKSMTSAYESALTTLVTSVLYVLTEELLPKSWRTSSIVDYTWLTFTASIPLIYNEVKRSYFNYDFFGFQNMASEFISYALLLKLNSMIRKKTESLSTN